MPTVVTPLSAIAWALVVRGLVAIAFAILTFVWPRVTLGAIVILFAVYALVDGAAGIAGALKERSRGWAPLVGGIVSVVAAIVTFLQPALTLLALVTLVAIWAITRGVLDIVAAIRLRREIEGDDRAVEGVRGLDRDARAVAGVGLGARRAAMVEAAHRGERLGEDRVALATLHVDDETDPTAVVLEAWVVEALLHGKIGIRVLASAVAFGHSCVVLVLGRSARRQIDAGAGLRGTTLARRRSEQLTGRPPVLALRYRRRLRAPARGRRAAPDR